MDVGRTPHDEVLIRTATHRENWMGDSIVGFVRPAVMDAGDNPEMGQMFRVLSDLKLKEKRPNLEIMAALVGVSRRSLCRINPAFRSWRKYAVEIFRDEIQQESAKGTVQNIHAPYAYWPDKDGDEMDEALGWSEPKPLP